MSQLLASLIRVAANQSSRNAFTNKLSGGNTELYQAAALAIQCAIFKADPAKEGNFIDDVANVASARIVIFDADKDSPTTLAEQVIPAAEFEACTWSQWTADTGQHFSFVFSNTEMNFAVPAAKTIYIEISVTLDDAGASLVPLCTATVGFRPFRSADADLAAILDGTAFSKEESDARYLRTDVLAPAFAATV